MYKFILVVFLSIFSVTVSADTIHFKNGYEIYGKVVKEPDSSMKIKSGNLRILFKNGGWMDVAKKSVEFILENDLDQFEIRK